MPVSHSGINIKNCCLKNIILSNMILNYYILFLDFLAERIYFMHKY